jgi:superfamily II DNA or RNA helicase
MVSATLVNNVRTMNRRNKHHIENGDHVLRDGSQLEIAHSEVRYFQEIDPDTNQLYTNGYIVAPGGMGKTITLGDLIVGINTMPNGRYVLGNPTHGKRVLIAVPSNDLVDQWADRLLGEFNEEKGIREPSIFGDRFTEDTVGIFHAGLSDEEKKRVLSKPVVIAVHDSIEILCANAELQPSQDVPFLKPTDFDCVLIDEVDDKVRGDATGRFYKEKIFPHCLVIGCTATHLFKSGMTIGHYLFGGKKPICEITHQEGVKRREIAPHVNIIFEPTVSPSSNIRSRTPGWDDYPDEQKLRFIEQTGSDNAILDIIKVGRHPVTEKPLRDMMKMHQAVNVEHAKEFAKKLKREFGGNYAEAVWGKTEEEMDDEMRRLIKWYLKTGELKSVVLCKLWGRGTDIPALEMTIQHAPTLSPNKLVQFHARASRKHDGKKIALYLSPYFQGIDQLVIGEVLGGLYMIPDGYEFPATEGKANSASDPKPWPDIRGVKVHYNQRQLEMFAANRHRQRYVNGLPVKPRHMLNLEETALMLGIKQNILLERVFVPLQEAYEKKQAREKFVDIGPARRDEFLHVRGKMFPAWRVGFYQKKAQEFFCVDQDLIPLCEHTLYGRLDSVPLEMLRRANARSLLRCSQVQIDQLWGKLQDAFFQRKPYERRVQIDGINFHYDSFGFYRNREGVSEFFISPDALVPALRNIFSVDHAAAARWAEQPVIRQCKTSVWLNEGDVVEELELNALLDKIEIAAIRKLFDGLRGQARGMRAGDQRELIVGKGKSRHLLNCSKRWLPLADASNQIALCVHTSALDWIKREVGIESAYDAKPSAYDHRSRSEDRPAP